MFSHFIIIVVNQKLPFELGSSIVVTQCLRLPFASACIHCRPGSRSRDTNCDNNIQNKTIRRSASRIFVRVIYPTQHAYAIWDCRYASSRSNCLIFHYIVSPLKYDGYRRQIVNSCGLGNKMRLSAISLLHEPLWSVEWMQPVTYSALICRDCLRDDIVRAVQRHT